MFVRTIKEKEKCLDEMIKYIENSLEFKKGNTTYPKKNCYQSDEQSFIFNTKLGIIYLFLQFNSDKILDGYKIESAFSDNYYINIEQYSSYDYETRMRILKKELFEAIYNDWE